MTESERRHFLGSNQAEYEVIYIHQTRAHGNRSIHKRDVDAAGDLVFEAFGRPYNLRLERNRHLLSEVSRIVRRLPGNVSREHERAGGDCHFLHAGRNLTAARGFVSDGDMLLDIAPLTPRLKHLVHTHTKRSTSAGFPHLARRSTAADVDSFVQSIDIGNDFLFPHEISPDEFNINDDFLDVGDALKIKVAPVELGEDRTPTVRGRRMIELGLFVDKAAREIFLPFFDNDLNEFIDFILGFINQIQALYYLPSLGTKVDISINYLEIMETQQMSHYDGERSQLLTSFCRYNARTNEKAAGRNSWDMGLYLSGLNFFEMVGSRRSPVTMGLAVIGGVCSPKYSCVIGELGTTNDQGKPYPSAGFTAAYIMAHEMGHNLGMFHDSQRNACPANGYIMSPSRGTKGETTWSACSRQTLRNMPENCLNDLPRKKAVQNHRIFREMPGQVYDAFDQCQLLLKDRDAEIFSPDDLYNVCERVKCKSPHRIGFYYAGPALEGTFCGMDRWCVSGSCRAWSSPPPPIIQGGWSDWNISACTSGCIEKATGIAISERRCDNPKPLNTEKRCPGPSTNTQFCNDQALCSYRLSVTQYASQKCREFSQIVKDLRADGEGTQVPHSDHKPWSACSIYCRLNSGTWYTPRQDLNDRGVDAYFPDGTWCHNDGSRDFYCQRHECRPKVADPPLPPREARAIPSAAAWVTTTRAPPTATTPFFRSTYQPERTTRRPDRTTSQPARTTYRPSSEAESGDRWQQQRPARPTRFPPRPEPTAWAPEARPTAWPPNNGLGQVGDRWL
ncbi:A disintegrin and metalloproteinase with thrombospondin motifs adt-2-like, partial [Pollicipes pollicipes]|uniref:A disintegrin and metalloproteinase with thrombospondin motifs adt-2-like n=1 Tax=Pollicipes pollicipes TaxID=41117 RepID=UPI001884A330